MNGRLLTILKARTEREIDTAFTALAQIHAGALFVPSDPFFTGRRDSSSDWRHAMPFRRFMTGVNSPTLVV